MAKLYAQTELFQGNTGKECAVPTLVSEGHMNGFELAQDTHLNPVQRIMRMKLDGTLLAR
jgi:hypothetical protein